MKTLAFDVYGTLIDTAGVVGLLRESIGDDAEAFSSRWRAKQLEYSFRYGLMEQYRDFRVCTRQALEHCCEAMSAPLDASARERLMARYLALPAFDDVRPGLERLARADAQMFAFSNGPAADVAQLLRHAGIDAYFDGVVSADEVKTFKPSPAVYRHFLRRAEVRAPDAWLVSSNPFDVCGARAVGMRAVWVRRDPAAVFDPWAFAPDREAVSFADLGDWFAAAQ
ncbi:MAG: haloacid dehalogenase type II [bacterium]